MRRIPVAAVVTTAAVLVGCHTITEELPTEPTESTQATPASGGGSPGAGVLTVAIPALTAVGTTPSPAPAASPTPAPATSPAPAPPPPAPTPTPEPAPPPSGGGGGGGGGGGNGVEGCSDPLPGPVVKVKAKIHVKGPNKYTLDATPLVGGREYCKEVGWTDNRIRCAVRPEGHPEREACEAYAVGRAEDTGRIGPTWTRNSSYCKGNACQNHPDNQFLLWAYKNGYYEACVKNGTCGSTQVDR